jgi:Domain of unknown function (DUF4381)
MQPVMQPALDQLRDIQGIGSVPWWPLATGWWLLMAALVVVAFALYHWRFILRLRVPIPGITLGTWRWDAAAALRSLRRRAHEGQDPKQTVGELSELLRRIAMARWGRESCAGLNGETWLAWLAVKDPTGFPWEQRGRLLITAPYAPPGALGERDLLALIDAAFAWVSAPDPKPAAGVKGSGIGRVFRLATWTRSARGEAANA